MHTKHLYLFLGFLFVGAVFFMQRSGMLAIFSPEAIQHTVEGYGVWAPVVYMAIYALSALLFVPASPLTILGGALFGPWYGALYTVLGATVGALFAFLASRTIGTSVMSNISDEKKEKFQTLRHYDKKIASHGFMTVLFLRFVPLIPFNVLNFALGFTKVTLRDYALGTFFGIIPGTIVFVLAGSSLTTLNPIHISIACTLIALLTYAGKYLLRKYDTKEHI
jgi:uncharacterized membrane protein YdjX (TVP38/TMEM64 family)